MDGVVSGAEEAPAVGAAAPSGTGRDPAPAGGGSGTAAGAAATPGSRPAPGAGVGLPSARRFFRTLWRRKLILLAAVLVVVGAAALLVLRMDPLYESEATLVVEIEPPAAASQAGGAGLSVETEAAIVASRDLAERVADRLDLMANPDYSPLLAENATSPADWILDPLVRAAVDALIAPRAAPLPARPDLADVDGVERSTLAREYAVSAFLAGLAVDVDPAARIITVRFAARDPAFAALAANTTAETYLSERLAGTIAPATDPGDSLRKRVAEVRAQLQDAEKRLREARQRSATAQLGDPAINQQQLARLNQELSLARVERGEAEARLSSAVKALESGKAGESGLLENAVVQNLREQEAEALQRISELSTKYRDRHPIMIQARADLESVRNRIALEQRKIVAQLRDAVRIAKVRESNLRAEIERLRKTVQAQSGAALEIQSLEAEVEATRRLFDSLVARVASSDRAPVQTPPIKLRMISAATVPVEPFFPPTAYLLGGALILGLVIGIGLVLLAEFLDNGFRTKDHLESMTGLPVLGMVPYMRGMERSGKKPHEIALEKPDSTYGAAIRGLRTALLLVRGRTRPRALMVTSSVPGEGKTSTSLAIACSAAKSGAKVIILECDILRPTLYKALGVPRENGLSDYLEGKLQIEEVVRIDQRSGAHFIPAGAQLLHGSDLLASAKMARLVRVLSQTYDLVVIDSPPVLAVADTIALAHMVDETLYLVRWAKTPREIAYAGLRTLLDSGARVGGLALTKVNVKKHAKHQYGRAGYHYYGAYEKYHSDK